MSESNFPGKLLRALNWLRRGMINRVWRGEARLLGLDLGQGIVFNGRPYFHRHPDSRIVLGKGTLKRRKRRAPVATFFNLR